LQDLRMALGIISCPPSGSTTDFKVLASLFCTDFSTGGLPHGGGVWIKLA
jgi:hypothetical protein